MIKLKAVLIAIALLPASCAMAAAGAATGQASPQVETLDRVVATIAGVPYTQSDLIHERRIEELIAGAPAKPQDASAAQGTLARFVGQKLLESELSSYHFNSNSIALEAKKQLAVIRNKFKSGSDFKKALRSAGVSESQLMSRLGEQEKIMAMIDMRLRPSASVSAKDIALYYHQTFLPGLARENRGPAPSLSAVEGKIREILVQKKINQLLDDWLLELRKERQVEILMN